MNELELVARLVPHLASRGGDLLIGAGEDDAAAWREDDGTFTVATCDTSVETIHFDLSRQAPEDVGWRALCFALGDLAAKGAWPTYGLTSISIPRRWEDAVAERIYSGLAELAGAVGLRLVGGDTTLAPGQGSLTLMLLGSTKVEPLPRSAVRAGWQVGVTGPLGGAGLHLRRPRPRLEIGTPGCTSWCLGSSRHSLAAWSTPGCSCSRCHRTRRADVHNKRGLAPTGP